VSGVDESMAYVMPVIYETITVGLSIPITFVSLPAHNFHGLITFMHQNVKSTEQERNTLFHLPIL